MTAESRPFRRQVLVNTASSGVANVWAMVVALVSLPILLGALGTEAFGTWVLLQTFSATNGWFSLADIGVVVATTREVATRASHDDLDGARHTVAASLQLCAGIGGLGALLLALVGPWVLPIFFQTPDDLVSQLRIATVVFSVQIVIDLVINSLEASLEGLQRVDLSRGVDVFRRTAVFAATAAAALITKELLPVALASMAATFVAAIVAAVVLWRRLPRFLTRPSTLHHRGLLRYGRSIAALRPLGVLQRTMDRIIVGVILGPAAVVLVEIATQLQAAADAVLSAASYAVVPTSSWLDARKDRAAIGELAEQGTKYSLLVTLPVVIAIALLAGPTIEVWLGSEYSAAAGLTAVAVANIALSAPLAVGSQMLLGMGKAGAILRAAIVAVTINLVGSLILVNVVGIVGVFQATLIGSLVLLPLLGRPFLTTVHVGLRDFLRVAIRPSFPPVLAQAVVTIGVLALPLSPLATLIAGGVLGLGVYAVVAWRLSLGRGELGDLARILRGQPDDPVTET